MRLFIALTFPDEILDALERLQEGIPLGRLVPRENFHLTLAFLGEVDLREVEPLDDALERLAADVFPVTLHGIGAFETPRALVIWAGVRPNPALEALHRKVRAAIHASGLMTGRERFRPHVTLARVQGQFASGDTARIAAVLSGFATRELGDFVAQGLDLIRSHRGTKGSHHEVLAHYPFADAIPESWT